MLAGSVVANAFGHSLWTEERELLELAREIREYLLLSHQEAGESGGP
jgi:hypothetical protein